MVLKRFPHAEVGQRELELYLGLPGLFQGPQSLADLPGSQYPNLVALAGQIMNPSMDDRFRFGLTIILDGLERRLTSH